MSKWIVDAFGILGLIFCGGLTILILVGIAGSIRTIIKEFTAGIKEGLRGKNNR